jgi:hypothetical protein
MDTGTNRPCRAAMVRDHMRLSWKIPSAPVSVAGASLGADFGAGNVSVRVMAGIVLKYN